MTPKIRTRPAADDLALYTRVAHAGSARIIREYSTSFRMAVRLLGREIRPDIENIYALVRVADEIVDGAASQAGVDSDAQRAMLDELERETAHAIARGYSANVVVHSFAVTARWAGIGSDLTAPFFASMRRDVSSVEFSASEFVDYVYGSAEVVGLMCLRVFLAREPVVATIDLQAMELGARSLGAAFQKVNFLRDLGADWGELGRCYFPGVDPRHLTESQKSAIVRDIEADLADAAAAIPRLPRSARRAVAAAHGLFAELNERIRRLPASDLAYTRVRVPTATKLMILWRPRTDRAGWPNGG